MEKNKRFVDKAAIDKLGDIVINNAITVDQAMMLYQITGDIEAVKQAAGRIQNQKAFNRVVERAKKGGY